MNKYKEQIYSCKDRKEVEAIVFDYETEEEKEAKNTKEVVDETPTVTDPSNTENPPEIVAQ